MSTTTSHGQGTVPEPAPGEARRVQASASRPALRFAVEWRRQIGRPRTRWTFGVLLALPLIVVAAFALGSRSNGSGTRFSDLATLGAANFVVFMLFISAELLLLIVATLFVGDSVPSEASWGSLRYLLTAPVGRARLLTSKLLVGLALTALAMVVLLVWAALIGGLVYGWAPLTVPLGGVVEWADLLPRLALAAGFIFVALLPFAAVALWMSVRTDAPLAAVGVAVLAAIVSSILDGIDSLGDWRRLLPNHYGRAWTELFSPQVDVTPMLHGALWALLWALVLGAFAYRHFRSKDVLS